MTVNWGYPPSWRIQDGLGIVLLRSFFRLAIRDHFFRLLCASWSRFGVSLASFWAILGSPGLVFGQSGWHVGVL